MGATAASLTADCVSKYCFGLRPVLDFGDIGQLSLDEYVWLIPLGLIAGLVGSMMNRSLLGFQTLYGRVPLRFRPVIAIALALPVGIWMPDVLGGGSNLISMAEHASVGLGMLCLLFVVKVLFTARVSDRVLRAVFSCRFLRWVRLLVVFAVRCCISGLACLLKWLRFLPSA